MHLPFSLKLNAFLVGVIGFGLNYGAYESEIYRAGISLDSHRPMGGRRVAGHVAGAESFAASFCRRRSRSSCRR